MRVEGDKEMLANLEKLKVRNIDAAKAALFAEAANIIADSKENYVPVDTGNLRKSAHTEKPKWFGKTISIKFGYGGTAAPYAAAVHENPRAGKTGGTSPKGRKYKTWAKTGGWKYLEFPFKKALTGMAERLAARMKKHVNR
jgi:hypothetical protein